MVGLDDLSDTGVQNLIVAQIYRYDLVNQSLSDESLFDLFRLDTEVGTGWSCVMIL